MSWASCKVSLCRKHANLRLALYSSPRLIRLSLSSVFLFCLKTVAAQNVEYYIYMCSPSACLYSKLFSLLCTCTTFLSFSSASPSGSSDNVSLRFPLNVSRLPAVVLFVRLRQYVDSCHGAITSQFLILFSQMVKAYFLRPLTLWDV